MRNKQIWLSTAWDNGIIQSMVPRSIEKKDNGYGESFYIAKYGFLPIFYYPGSPIKSDFSFTCSGATRQAKVKIEARIKYLKEEISKLKKISFKKQMV